MMRLESEKLHTMYEGVELTVLVDPGFLYSGRDRVALEY